MFFFPFYFAHKINARIAANVVRWWFVNQKSMYGYEHVEKNVSNRDRTQAQNWKHKIKIDCVCFSVLSDLSRLNDSGWFRCFCRFFFCFIINVICVECISCALHYVPLDNLGFLMVYEPFDMWRSFAPICLWLFNIFSIYKYMFHLAFGIFVYLPHK